MQANTVTGTPTPVFYWLINSINYIYSYKTKPHISLLVEWDGTDVTTGKNTFDLHRKLDSGRKGEVPFPG